jgi:ABC-type Fe3+ transport system permease subunit
MWANADVFSLALLVAIGSFCVGAVLAYVATDRSRFF